MMLSEASLCYILFHRYNPSKAVFAEMVLFLCLLCESGKPAHLILQWISCCAVQVWWSGINLLCTKGTLVLLEKRKKKLSIFKTFAFELSKGLLDGKKENYTSVPSLLLLCYNYVSF